MCRMQRCSLRVFKILLSIFAKSVKMCRSDDTRPAPVLRLVVKDVIQG
jgi:hypothetical protein